MSDLFPPKREQRISEKGIIDKDFAEILEDLFERSNFFQVGDGDPINSLITSRKMIFLRQDGGVGTTLYVNELGDGTDDGWRAI